MKRRLSNHLLALLLQLKIFIRQGHSTQVIYADMSKFSHIWDNGRYCSPYLLLQADIPLVPKS